MTRSLSGEQLQPDLAAAGALGSQQLDGVAGASACCSSEDQPQAIPRAEAEWAGVHHRDPAAPTGFVQQASRLNGEELEPVRHDVHPF